MKKMRKSFTISLTEAFIWALTFSVVVSLASGGLFEVFGANLSAFNGAMIIFPLIFISNLMTLMTYFAINVYDNKNKK